MSDPMQEIRASFFLECEELLEAMQDGLQRLEEEDDAETINVVFRAVHSIKGGAGAFGLDDLVAFAHIFETALDGVRSGSIPVDDDVLKLFFQCGDVLADHVRAARDEEALDPDRYAGVLSALTELSGEQAEEDDLSDFQPMALSMDLPDLDDDCGSLPDLGDFGAAPSVTLGWNIRFAPKDELFASGNEPLYLFRALRDIGELSLRPNLDGIPTLDALEPICAYLSWNAHLVTEEAEPAIRDIFEFVEDVCDLEIVEEVGSPTTAVLPPLPAVTDGAAGEQPEGHRGTPTDTFETAAPSDAAALDATEVIAMPSRAQSAKDDASEKKAVSAPKATVRVDLDRIDRLVNLVGELVINQAMLAQSVAEAGVPSNSPVTTGLDEFLQLTRDIQESVMMIRAQPVKSLFQRMGRIVRKSAAAVGKDVRLKTDGDATEIDKTVIELLAEPLTHMIRNAVDHGLEKTAERLAAGKPEQGVVTLTAGHRSGRVVIEIGDDGAGINRERVLAKAIEKNLVPADAQLTDAEIDNILFMPGFSTASEVSNLSGRGVGMDVVKTAITSLGGRITTTSSPGHGTSFSISLPLTLAVLDGMVIKVEQETLVVPLTAIQETLTLTDDDIRSLGPETQVVKIRDAFVPLLDLGIELGYREPLDSYAGTIALLITQEDGTRIALIVDAIEDQRQVVIKGLHDSYGHVRGVAAATILGDGQIALILDAADLVANASGRSRRSYQPTALAG